MLFDVQSALAEILNESASSCDSCDTREFANTKSQKSQKSPESQSQESESQSPRPLTVKARELSCHAANPFPHGGSPGGRPLTWTGRVVSLEAWRNLSD